MPEPSKRSVTHAYIGIEGGKCVAAIADDGRHPAVAKEVAKLIRSGCTVERVTVEIARLALFEPWPRPST